MSKEHKALAERLSEIKFLVTIVSTSRYEKILRGEKIDDESGDLALNLIEKFGFKVVEKKIISDDLGMIENVIDDYIGKVDVILFIGGTGLGVKDYTYEVVRKRVRKEIPGFGELFRFLSYREIGSSAILSRAFAGLVDGKLIVCIPGSVNAVRLALTKLLLPEVKHILLHARKG